MAVLVAALVFSLAHLDKDWVGGMWAFASSYAYGWIRLASRSTIPAVIAYNKFTVEIGRFAGMMQTLIGRSSGLLSRAAVEGD